MQKQLTYKEILARQSLTRKLQVNKINNKEKKEPLRILVKENKSASHNKDLIALLAIGVLIAATKSHKV
jgi:hypothetical protein